MDAARDVLAAMLEVLWGGWGLGSDMGVAAGRGEGLRGRGGAGLNLSCLRR